MAALDEDLDRPSRWPVLDGFRGVAVLSVIAYHALKLVLDSQGLVDAGPTSVWLWPLGIGRFGVDGFFVLSGFLIVTAWDRRPELGPFFWRRVRRLWPAYLVSVAVLVPLVAPELLRSTWDLFLLVTLQGYVSDGLTTSVNVPWWSLTTEVHFYLLVPLLAPLLHRPRLRWLLLVASCVLAAWWWDGGASAVGLSPSLLPGRLCQFVVGALVGVVLRERGAGVLTWTLAASRWVGRLALAGVLALGLYVGANGTAHRADVGLDHWIEPLVGLLLGVLLLHLVVRTEQGGHPPLEHPAFRTAGLVSYSAYLWHFPILAASVRWLDVADHPLLAGPALVVGLATTALVTALSYRWVERPILYGRSTSTPEPERAPAVT